MHSWLNAISWQLSANSGSWYTSQNSPLERGWGCVYWLIKYFSFLFPWWKRNKKSRPGIFGHPLVAHFLKLKNSAYASNSSSFFTEVSPSGSGPAKSYGRRSLRRYYYWYWSRRFGIGISLIRAFVAQSLQQKAVLGILRKTSNPEVSGPASRFPLNSRS